MDNLVLCGFLFILICMVVFYLKLTKMEAQHKSDYNSLDRLNTAFRSQSDNRRKRQRKVDKSIDRLKLSQFFMANKNNEASIDVLSGRLSDEAVQRELYDLRRAITKGGVVDKAWVFTAEDNTDGISHD